MKDMPIVINQNLYTSLGIVNGKEPIGVYVVIGESAKVYFVGHNVWIVDSPPKCLLAQIQDSKFTPMQGLSEGALPIFSFTFWNTIDRNVFLLGAGNYRVVQDLL